MRRLKRSECAVLPLVLKGRWYDMIERGEKTEEYRDVKWYWDVRIDNWNIRYIDGYIAGTIASDRRIVEFRRGHVKNAPRMAFRVMDVRNSNWCELLHGKPKHPEWGEPGTPHWIIRLGERVELTDG